MIDTEALRKKIIDLAIQGKLTEQLSSDGDAESLYVQIQEEKAKLKKEGKIKKEKSLSKITENEIPFEIPKNWKWVRFGDTTFIERGGSPRPIKSYLTDSEVGINWIKIGDVEKGGKYIYSTKEKIIPEGEKKSRHVYPGDFLLTNSMSFGRPYISKVEGCIHDGWLLIRDLKGFCDDYLYYLLSSTYMYGQFCNKASGATVDNLNIDKVNSALIPLAPIEEQRRIAEVIQKVDLLIKTIDNLQQQYESDLSVLKSKIIDAGIRGKLTTQLPEDGVAETLYAQIQEEKAKLITEGKIKKEKPLPEIEDDEIPFEIPKNWKWVRLGELSKVITKGSSPKWQGVNYTDREHGILFVTSENVGNDTLLLDGKTKYVESKFNEMHPSSILQKGDILTNIVGASIGRSAVFDLNIENANINQAVSVIRLINLDMTDYIRLFLQCPFEVKHLLGDVTDSGRPNLSLTSVANLMIALPPREEQQRIIAKMEELLLIFE